MGDMSGLFLNNLFSLLLKKIIVPTDYHSRVACVKAMLEDDVSGLVDSLTDFSVQTASVDFSVETDSEGLTKILKKWLDNINSPYKGQIPRGIKPLAEEYFKERWKSSSFPILKIAKWERINGINVPTKMFFVDGESIRAEEIDNDKETKDLIGYKYFLGAGDNDPLDKGVIITKPYGRWFDEYPTPYLIKRGVYHNWRIIQSLKNRETEILEQIIPYLFLVKKGSEALTKDNIKIYSQPELEEIKNQFQELMNKMNAFSSSSADKSGKSPIRVSQFDEEIKHLIPDLSSIFDPQLFASAEKSILSGLGFVDIAEAVSTSRRESILNPKAFIEETKKGVEDFKGILKELIARIIEENKSHKKYMNTTFYIVSSPVKGFITNDAKNQFRLLWERGQLSNQTYCELVGEVEFRTEVARREKEAREGLDYTMYPHIRENREGVGIDIPGEEPVDKDTDKKGDPIPTDKLDDKDKYNIGASKTLVKCSHCGNYFDFLAEKEAGMGWVKCPKCSKSVTQKDLIESKLALETAPYTRITQLPDNVKKKLSPAKQRSWMKIFNNAYRFYLGKFGDPKKAETLAFRTAWSQIRNVKSKKRGN